MDNSPEVRNEEVSLDRPLSPVLSTGKKNNRLKFRDRLRKKTSKTNLSKRFAESEMVQSSTTRETVCLYFSDLPDPSDSPEIRLKKLQGMEERRREYLKYLTEIHTEREQICTTTQESDGVMFKKPLTPIVKLKVKKECTQYSTFKERETNGQILQKNDETIDVTPNIERYEPSLIINEKTVKEMNVSDGMVSQYNTTLTDSQVNSLADEIESVVSRDDDGGAANTQEKNSYFKYVSHFLNRLEKYRNTQHSETSPVSQTQAVSDINVRCQNMLDLIKLVDKSSVSSTANRTYECPIFHGFKENCIKLAKQKANVCSNMIAIYEEHNKYSLNDAFNEKAEHSISCHKQEVTEQISIPHMSDKFVRLYDNNSEKNCKELETTPDFDKQKQTQEWFNSCFAEADFKKCNTNTIETSSVNVSEMGDSQTKKYKSVCHSPGFGFKCANGRNAQVSDAALLKAAKVFEEVIQEVKFADKQNDLETIHLNSKFSNNSLRNFIPSTTTTIENDEEISVTEFESAHTLQVQSAPTVTFACASGKGIAISKNALVKTKSIFNDIEKGAVAEIKKTKNAETQLTGLKTGAGNGTSVSAEAFGSAQKMYVDTNQNQDNTIVSKTPINERKVSRKHLGVSPRVKQIPIQQDNFEKSRKMLEDISGDIPKNFSDGSNVKSTFSLYTPKKHYDGPYISTPICNSSPIFFDKFGSGDKQTVNQPKKLKSCNTANSEVVIQNPTTGNITIWLEELTEEQRKLEEQLKIVCLKLKMLQQQKVQLETEKIIRPVAGILFTKKRATEKISLRNFVENAKPGEQHLPNVDSTVLSIMPKNALLVHFVYKGGVLETFDGAKIISNNLNLIGISEIKTAFETMPGVQCSLLPKGWIENHYKWIVWKLASMQRAFPLNFDNCLTIENIMEDLKYRYDREIDRVERSALRRILEKDDVSQKRMVLCVSDIKKGVGELCELELTDGWYAVRTVLDSPLNELVKRHKIKIGFKLVTQGAELINCEGCHPLQAPACVYLKIHYNCTRRAAWDAKLGFHSFPNPLLISLKSINFKGGPVGRIKVYLARVYPLRYMERQGNSVVWRNERAEEKRAKAFINEKLQQLEDVQYKVQKDYEKEMQEVQQKKKRKIDVSNEHSGSALYDMLMHTADPESIVKQLTPSQLAIFEDYKKERLRECEEKLSSRLKEVINKSNVTNREVIPILKISVIDASDYSETNMALNVWKPTDELLHVLKEGRVFSIYSAVPKNNGSLGSSCKTRFKEEAMVSSHFKKFSRQIIPIALTMQAFHKPFLNEFDTVGIVVKTKLDETTQDLWLTDFTGRLLLIKVSDSPDRCSVFDHIARGQIVTISNLVLCEPQSSFGFAMGNQYTVVTRYPKDKLLKEALELFLQQRVENMETLLNDCDKKVSVCITKLGFINTLQNKSYSETLLAQTTSLTINDILTDSSEDEGGLPSKLTSMDVALSLIDMESLAKN